MLGSLTMTARNPATQAMAGPQGIDLEERTERRPQLGWVKIRLPLPWRVPVGTGSEKLREEGRCLALGEVHITCRNQSEPFPCPHIEGAALPVIVPSSRLSRLPLREAPSFTPFPVYNPWTRTGI